MANYRAIRAYIKLDESITIDGALMTHLMIERRYGYISKIKTIEDWVTCPIGFQTSIRFASLTDQKIKLGSLYSIIEDSPCDYFDIDELTKTSVYKSKQISQSIGRFFKKQNANFNNLSLEHFYAQAQDETKWQFC